MDDIGNSRLMILMLEQMHSQPSSVLSDNLADRSARELRGEQKR